MESFKIPLSPLLSFIISFLLFPVLIKLLEKFELYGSSKEHKIHDSFTPSLGGVAIYAGVILSLIVLLPFQEWISLKYFFISISLMFLIGLRDDVLGLSPTKKLVSQLLPIVILVVFGQVVLNVTLFSISLVDLSKLINAFVVITAIVLITNSYNLIDGLDGLAGSIGIICLSIFGVWFYYLDYTTLSLVSVCSVGSLIAFLYYNWQPSKIFMGDTGALLIGLLLSYFSIQFLNTNEALELGHPMKFQSSIGALVCIIIIPVFDTSRVVILRLRKGLSPFKADKNHLHHQFLKIGFNHSKSVISITTINLMFVVLAWLMKYQADQVILPVVVILCLFINFGLKWAQKNARTNNQTGTRA